MPSANIASSKSVTHSAHFAGEATAMEAELANLERGERLQIMLNEEELAAVENWRFERRMPSRAAAVRELLRRGLAGEGS